MLVAEVIEQKLAGKTLIEVQLEFEDEEVAAPEPQAEAAPAASTPPPEPVVPATPAAAASPAPVAPTPEVAEVPPAVQAPAPLPHEATVKMVARKTAPAGCRLVSILQSGVEANEFELKVDGPTTIGRHGADISFPEDLGLSDIHARIVPSADGYRVRDEGSAEGVFLQPAAGRLVTVRVRRDHPRGRQWLVVGDDPAAPGLVHYDTSGRHVARHDLKTGTTIFGRQSPDITIAPDDGSLSRRHFATVVQDGQHRREGSRQRQRHLREGRRARCC